MKKLVVVALLLLSTNALFAQKYMTRTGKVSFYSKASLENIEAVDNETASVIDSKSGDVVFQVPIKGFKFEKTLMQDHFNEDYMESSKFPKADFKGKITNLSTVDFSKDGSYNVQVAGKLTIHGVTKDVNIPGTLVVKGGSVTSNSKFHIKTEDYGIKIPSMMSSKIAEDIEITVNSILSPMSK